MALTLFLQNHIYENKMKEQAQWTHLNPDFFNRVAFWLHKILFQSNFSSPNL